MNYTTLSRWELESCLDHLNGLVKSCYYPPMLPEYQRRIDQINFLLKYRS